VTAEFLRSLGYSAEQIVELFEMREAKEIDIEDLTAAAEYFDKLQASERFMI